MDKTFSITQLKIIQSKITYDNIQNMVTDQGDGYTTGCLLAYLYFTIIIRWQE